MKKFGMIMLVVVLLVPCSTWTEGKDLVFGVSLDALFLGRQAEMTGVRAAAEENGIKLLESVADNDAQQQNAQIKAFITQGVDAILIVAGDVVPEDVLALAEQYYGVIPAEPQLPERLRPEDLSYDRQVLG